jgi:hypothetical protein
LFFRAVSKLLKNKKSKKAKIGRGLHACIGKPKRERHKKRTNTETATERI